MTHELGIFLIALGGVVAFVMVIVAILVMSSRRAIAQEQGWREHQEWLAFLGEHGVSDPEDEPPAP